MRMPIIWCDQIFVLALSAFVTRSILFFKVSGVFAVSICKANLNLTAVRKGVEEFFRSGVLVEDLFELIGYFHFTRFFVDSEDHINRIVNIQTGFYECPH